MKIDYGSTEKLDETKDGNEGVSFDAFDLTIDPDFAKKFFVKA
jgi:hypothetical protein